MKKYLVIPIFALLLVGCGNSASNGQALRQRLINGETMANLLKSYNQEGYTKKTAFQFVESILNDTHYFHAGTNNRERATYYHKDEGMLLMGDYLGTFNDINSSTTFLIESSLTVKKRVSQFKTISFRLL